MLAGTLAKGVTILLLAFSSHAAPDQAASAAASPWTRTALSSAALADDDCAGQDASACAAGVLPGSDSGLALLHRASAWRLARGHSLDPAEESRPPPDVARQIYGRVVPLIRDAPAVTPRSPQSLSAAAAAAAASVTRADGPPLRLLTGVVADSKPETRARAMHNIEAASSWLASALGLARVAFAFIIYDGGLEDWREVERFGEKLGINTTAMSGGVHDLWPDHFMGKLVFQARLAPMLSAFDVVWLMDADIAWPDNFLGRFFETWGSAFDGGPPLISSAVVRQNTQDLTQQNYNTWTDPELLGGLNASAAATRFVESQMPLLDTGFFAWFLRRWLDNERLQRYVELATDWVGQVWCGFAESYAQDVLQTPSRTPCAVVTEPIDHDDSHTAPTLTMDFNVRGSMYLDFLDEDEVIKKQGGVLHENEFWYDFDDLSWCRRRVAGGGAGPPRYEACSWTRPVDCERREAKSFESQVRAVGMCQQQQHQQGSGNAAA